MCDFRLPPQCKWDLRSFGIYTVQNGSFLQTFWDNLSSPIFNLEDGTDSLFRNVGKKLQFYTA
jgi:hypothetical protein